MFGFWTIGEHHIHRLKRHMISNDCFKCLFLVASSQKTCLNNSERVWSMWNICEHVGSSLSCSTRISELAKQPQPIQIGLPDVIFKWPRILGDFHWLGFLRLESPPPPKMPGCETWEVKVHSSWGPLKKGAVFFSQFPGCMERLAYTCQQTSVPRGSHVW